MAGDGPCLLQVARGDDTNSFATRDGKHAGSATSRACVLVTKWDNLRKREVMAYGWPPCAVGTSVVVEITYPAGVLVMINSKPATARVSPLAAGR